MVDSEKRDGSLSGLSEQEAKDFHRIFMASFFIFVIVAIVAHILAWQWRPWLPGPHGYSSMLDTAKTLAYEVLPTAFSISG
ncbi:MAG: light-harvesting antenna LH1, beta subunit [Burkholderiaceae bacterium]|jgi:light-harvesting complex 1 beta chain